MAPILLCATSVLLILFAALNEIDAAMKPESKRNASHQEACNSQKEHFHG